MNRLFDKMLRNYNRQHLIDGALIFAIILMAFIYKLHYQAPLH